MIYAKIENGEVTRFPYSIEELRKENPNVSFPRKLNDDDLEAFGVVEVKLLTRPPVNNLTQLITRKNPELVNGEWVVGWTVETRPDAEDSVRRFRNNLLKDSDWTQGKDIPDGISGAWATYRQELRDLSSKEEWPNVAFPAPPSI